MITQKKLLLLAVFIAFGLILPLQSQASNYYDISEENRPPSAYSNCCCEKENQNDKQIFYTCKLIEGECPENTKHYPGLGIDCPGSLMFTKYKK